MPRAIVCPGGFLSAGYWLSGGLPEISFAIPWRFLGDPFAHACRSNMAELVPARNAAAAVFGTTPNRPTGFGGSIEQAAKACYTIPDRL
jgi:hypothetical protein